MKHLISLLCGLMFGLGLILTGMYSPDIIVSGLKIGAQTFRIDMYLTFVTALTTTFLIYQLKRFLPKPLTHHCYELPAKRHIEGRLVIGAALFGIGWGMTGICPGPNVVGLAIFSWPFFWVNFLGIVIGFLIARKIPGG